MPALRIYGRRWHIATDVVPLPAGFGAVYHLLLAVVFGGLIGHYKLWTHSCRGPGNEYIATTAGLMGVFVLSFVAETAATVIGLRGTPLEVSKRRYMIPILYVQSWLWLAQFALLVFGTFVVADRWPHCWPTAEQDDVHRVVKALIALTWVTTFILGILVFIIYNSYPDHDKEESWEQRCAALSWCFGCRDQMTHSISPDKADPLRSIAQWISGLFGAIDLAPSDISVALILAAAAQRARRTMRIRRALQPRLDMLSETASSAAPSEADIEELDEMMSDSAALSEADTESTASRRGAKFLEHTSRRAQQSGDISSAADKPMAMPKNLPPGWAEKAEEAYRDTAREAKRAKISHSSSSSGAGPPDGQQNGTLELTPGRTDSAKRDPSRRREGRRKGQHTRDAGLQPKLDPDSAHESPVRTVSLSQISESTLHSLTESEGGTPRSQINTQDFQDALSTQASLRSKDPEAEAGDADAGLPDDDSEDGPALLRTPSGHAKALEMAAGRGPGSHGVSSGPLQAAPNEPGYGLPPPSQLHVSASGHDNWGMPPSLDEIMQDDKESGVRPSARLTEAVDRKLQIQEQAEAMEEEGEEPRGEHEQRYSLDGVPLARQISYKYPTVLTPTEQVDSVVGNMMDTREAIAEALGERNRVDYPSMEQASRFARYALAVYGVKPITESKCPCTCPKCLFCCGPTERVTPESIRRDVLELADISDEDLLHFSHDNTALSHLPYMIVLDRPAKTVVVALRGTVSIADLVTDAVVHPECIDSWLPKGFRKKHGMQGHMYAHAGMVAAATAILEDLEAVGVLPALVKDDTAKGKTDAPNTQRMDSRQPSQGHQKTSCEQRADERVMSEPAADGGEEPDTSGHGDNASEVRSSAMQDNPRRQSVARDGGNGASGRHPTTGAPNDTPFAAADLQHSGTAAAGDEQNIAEPSGRQGHGANNHVAIDMPTSPDDVSLDAAARLRAISGSRSPAQRQNNQRARHGQQAGDIEMGNISEGEADAERQASGNAKGQSRAGSQALTAATQQTGQGGGTSDPQKNAQQREEGEEVGNIMKGVIDVKGWRLVLTGHSLGAGTAALVALKLRPRFEDLHCWAFCPPGGLISANLIPFMEPFCTSLVVGKDAVPRMSVNNMQRLMEEMVTALARCRFPKMQVVLGAWWRKANRPPSKKLFAPYRDIPLEARRVLERYHQSVDKKGKALDMFPPGRIIFHRPIKTIGRKRHRIEKFVPHRTMEKQWDAVWITPRELMAEGILVSKKMLQDHLLASTVVTSLRYIINHHPQNPKSPSSKRRDAAKDEEMQKEGEEVADIGSAPV